MAGVGLIMDQAQIILQGAIDAISPRPPATIRVIKGLPTHLNDAITVYFYLGTPLPDVPKAGPSIVWRWHRLLIRLLIRRGGDWAEAEALAWPFYDAIGNVAYTNHTLNNTAHDSKVLPLSQGSPAAIIGGVEYRQEWWEWQVADEWAFIQA